MTDRPFRFGVVAVPQGTGDQWRATARRVEELGYDTLLMPDGLQLPSPVAALPIAAAVTTRLRVGTFVMASPLRAPRLAAWEAHSLSTLLDGRFELGIGTGRPEVAKQAVELLGAPDIPPARRLAQVEQTIDALRELEGDAHTPVMIAAGGPKSRALAGQKADIVVLGVGPLSSQDEVRRMADDVRETAGKRAAEVEFAMNIFIVGEEAPAWTQQFLGTDVETLRERDSLTMLRGTTQEMADELRRRRDVFGTSYVTINHAFFEEAAPVVQLLAGG
jgi:alkanesulfonate monooxygenase SsuD/methylene tetrahydromethanopterin reductase-like flavin-dependent oxidoreductase (luciferase family)